MKKFSKDMLPVGWDGEWKKYRKTAVTSAMRINGPFEVQTAEGPLTCDDGYLCLDSRGYPYPVAKDEFELIYVETD